MHSLHHTNLYCAFFASHYDLSSIFCLTLKMSCIFCITLRILCIFPITLFHHIGWSNVYELRVSLDLENGNGKGFLTRKLWIPKHGPDSASAAARQAWKRHSVEKNEIDKKSGARKKTRGHTKNHRQEMGSVKNISTKSNSPVCRTQT